MGRNGSGGGDFMSGAIGALAGMVGGAFGVSGSGMWAVMERTLAAAAAGGTAAEMSGGSFANGAFSAAFNHLFNDEVRVVFGRVFNGYRYSGDMQGLVGKNFGPGNLYGECAAGAQVLSGAPDTIYWAAGNPTLQALLEGGANILSGTVFASMGGPGGRYANGAGNSGNYDHTIMYVSDQWEENRPSWLARQFGATSTWTHTVTYGEQYIGQYKPVKIAVPYHLTTVPLNGLVGGTKHTPYRLVTGK